jgi:hypothetical protein
MKSGLDFKKFFFFSLICTAGLALSALSRDAVGDYVANSIFAVIGFLQGCGALWMLWDVEMQGSTRVPMAWACFAAEHIAFGLGGALTAVFNVGYGYDNALGAFSYSDGIIPLMTVHIVSLNVGLLGARFGASRARRGKQPGIQESRDKQWGWSEMAPLCYASLAIHGLVWIVILNLKLAGMPGYVAFVFSTSVNAAFFFWGLAWQKSRMKPVFLIYVTIFTIIEMIGGGRGTYMFPLLLFGLGYAVSPAGRQFRFVSLLKWSPVLVFVWWSFTITEDLRGQYGRGVPLDVSDAIARVTFLAEAPETDTDTNEYLDTYGAAINGPFRVGSRLFELSAMNVVQETPRSIPFWGFDDEDWSILWTGLLPLKLSPGAAYNTSETAGVLWLHAYGFTQVDPVLGNSMPATILADSWRRWGWPGVVLAYLVLGFVLARLTAVLRLDGAKTFWMLMVAGIVVANYAFIYTLDIIYATFTVPRRVLIILVYAGVLYAAQRFTSSIQIRSAARAVGRRFSSGSRSLEGTVSNRTA